MIWKVTPLSTSHPSSPPIESIIAGTWSFAVNNGQVKQFKWDTQAISLDGRVNYTMTINGMTNTSNVNVAPHLSLYPIKLVGNYTAFKGNRNIDIIGKLIWNDVPAVVTSINGKLLNFAPDPVKTEGVFSTPLFDIVTTLNR